jgi:hypothetical protein
VTETPSAVDRAAVADVTADALAAQVVSAGHQSRIAPLNVAVGILTVIALVAALYLARAFFIPLLICILASYALKPVLDWFSRVEHPAAAGSAGRWHVLNYLFVER